MPATSERAGPARLNALRQRLARREDSEHVQALIRIAFGLVISIYLYATIGPRTDVHVVCIGFALLSCAIFLAIVFQPRPSAVRRTLGAVLDIGTTTYLMWRNGEAGAPLYGIYLWVTFGNGFRYGVGALRVSHALSMTGFALVLALNPFWHQHSLMAGGFLILLAAVPFYGAVLLKDVKTAQDKAEQANEAKSRFLSIMSHEIRTPLNGIIGINALLKRTKVTPEQLDLINTLGMSSEILLSLLDNVLDIAKIEAGKMAIEGSAFDFYRVIQGVHQFAATQAVSKGLRLSVCLDAAVPRQLVGDPHRLRQILINLLANAIKFTHQGGVHLRIALISEKHSVARVRCEVIDTGIGIPQDALSRIFEPFIQADQSTTREYGGTGLGTAIAKQLVDLMNGRMGADSVTGQGSTFWFEVPLPVPDAQPLPSLQGINVLLVNLGSSEREHLATLLEAALATVTAVPASGALAIIDEAASTDNPYQVVIAGQVAHIQPLLHAIASPPGNTRKPRIVALSPASSEGSRMTMIDTPYSVVVNQPLQKECLLRAVHFAALENDHPGGSPTQKPTTAGIRTIAQRLRVLVAEDNATNRRIIAQILEYGGYEVSLATTGTQALECLHHAAFDVVILDKHMPGMSGVEVAKSYLQSHGDKAAPMIMLTAEATAEAMDECKAAGMKAFLTKPIDPEMLFETIQAIVFAGTARTSTRLTTVSQDPIQHPVILDESVLRELDKHAPSARFMVEIVESFESDLQQSIEDLESAVNAGNWQEIADIRHTIEGTARSSGAMALAAMLPQLKSLDTCTPTERQLRLSEFRTCVATTIAALKRFLANRPGGR